MVYSGEANSKCTDRRRAILQAGTKRKQVTGAVPIIPTPFDANEEIDEDALRRMVEFAVASGLEAICLPAYGSEFYKLSDQEQARVVQIAVSQAAGRLRVIAQSNHGSSRIALSMARAHVESGADLISVALPRQFALTEDDLLRYLTPILNGVDVACLVQDFNPGGPMVSVNFVSRMQAECPDFQYLKLEEPLMAPKVRAIREATNDAIGILEGWGGLYVMELVPAGICGVMPGLATADILNAVFHLRKADKCSEAFELFEKVLPQISFALQNMELFVYCEKRLLQARGLLSNARCRKATFTPDPYIEQYINELNSHLLQDMETAHLTVSCRKRES
jgi:2-keto-3-deoxy-L-arabinonate dehydratase